MPDSDWKHISELLEMDVGVSRVGRKIMVTVSQNVNDDYLLIDVRRFFEDKNGEWHATRQGISLSPDQWATVVAVLQTWLDEQ